MNNKVTIYCGRNFHMAFTNDHTVVPCDPGKAQKSLENLGFVKKCSFENEDKYEVQIWEKKREK